MSEPVNPESANDLDKIDDGVDPRVQIELERLNTATDDINRLEVDLDEARAAFRELLCESTITINSLAKKLGSCIDKSKPYYDSRFEAQEALRKAQKAAIRFERANGQHAAAKEMVYLAEEGLRMEGRSFDHAWQEMLNHATERVNESEHERAISEAEHRHMTAMYHLAEHNVQQLQSELKRSIAKSRPYYEMKAQFNQALEKQKYRVSELERCVGAAKMTYAEALRNLEKISDEIHRTRKYDNNDEKKKKELENGKNAEASAATSSDSSVTGSPDSTDYTSDEYLRLPEKMSPNASCPVPLEREASSEYLGLTTLNLSSTEPRKYIKRDRPKNLVPSTPIASKSNQLTSPIAQLPELISPKVNSKDSDRNSKANQIVKNDLECKKEDRKVEEKINGDEWTEISLNNSPEEIYYNNEMYSDDEDQIPYKPLPSELSPEPVKPPVRILEPKVDKKRLVTQQSLPATKQEPSADGKSEPGVAKSRGKLDSTLANWISRSSAGEASSVAANASRRQSLDTLWNTGTGERMKELLSHGMMMLNISGLTERRSSEPKVIEKEEKSCPKPEKIEVKGKKVPSPLEKTMSYLNPDEETSDSESLASVEMLTEDQISCLMMEPDMNQVCQEVLGTPLVEVCPLLEQLQNQQ